MLSATAIHRNPLFLKGTRIGELLSQLLIGIFFKDETPGKNCPYFLKKRGFSVE